MIAACVANFMAAGVFFVASMVLLFTAGSSGALSAAGYCTLGVMMLSALIAVVRSLQCAYAGRAFRAGRPFIKSG